MNRISDLWRLMRPRQWVKNSFVLTGILFANAWRDPELVKRVLLATAAFSLVASGVYIVNDLIDRPHDLNHPRKKQRPLAAQTVSVTAAVVLLIILWIAAFSLGFLVSRTVMTILLIYVVVNVAYSLHLKHVVILDVFIIASGFMLRILAGTVGVGIAPSQWLLLCGLMMALFLGFAKRRAELYAMTDDGPTHRRVLGHYQPVLLDNMIVVTATCVILTYSLYTMSPTTIQVHHTESLIYTVPFVIYGIFRYIYSLHRQNAGSDPALQIFRDPHLLLAIIGWLIVTLWLIASAR
ncbi:MAG TPA: decaprenyl-phosphate phosphoribosyltransferase [Pyrinomonadaceae bacterium]|nr:decaprenyl-phosphate phosphoribosyltransferase [Pyrinomonadaceae bacterium]